MTVSAPHRLDGLEPDNLLGFLALLGLLRALEAGDRAVSGPERLQPRVAWDIDAAAIRPTLHLAREISREAVAERALVGLAILAGFHDFEQRKDLNHSRSECRSLLMNAATAAGSNSRQWVDLLAALMSDAAIKDDKQEAVDPTPLCLLFGQGHQHFLDRLASVPREPAPPPRGKGRKSVRPTAADSVIEALFHPWRRGDQSFSFRWDPAEDVRYALMAGDPTDAAYKPGTQHGANCLAAVGLVALTVVPQTRRGRVRPGILGGASGPDGFSFAWPVWRDPATLSAIRGLLAHPQLRQAGGLGHLGVDHVMVARRISVGKFMNFTRARPVM